MYAGYKERVTQAELDEIPEVNPIAIELREMEHEAREVITGKRLAAYLCGGAGCGKSSIIERVCAPLRAKGIEPHFARPSRDEDLAIAYETAGARPLILEEADNLWTSPLKMNSLKITTDKHRKPRVLQYKEGKQLIDVFAVAPTLVTTNLDLTDESMMPPVARPHMEAIRRRAHPRVLPIADTFENRCAKWEWAVYLAVRKRMIATGDNGVHPSVQLQNEVLKWFTENMWRLGSVSPGILRELMDQVLLVRARGNGKADWRESLQSYLTKPHAVGPIQPEAPQIWVAPRYHKVRLLESPEAVE